LIFLKNFVIIYISNEGSQSLQKNIFKKIKKVLTNFKRYDIINISNETNKQFLIKERGVYLWKR
jgi:hypothetical protein